eukprot:TRINITY_DN724_c0_g1_i1.p1 TRINITY_DN724_c0_g1~~TRINITY_DN724_c0_g1_i1.p1  ORF type:complete len:399 (-),score=67.99 TRINITY_DN724_c0_g1_i1:156-1352(-)
MNQDRPHLIKKKIEKFYVTETIVGQGTWPVKLSFNAETNAQVAVKCIEKFKLSQMGRQNLRREVQIHTFVSSYHHPSIANLHKVVEDENFIYLFVEYMPGGDIISLLEKKGKLSEKEARIVIRSIAKSIQFLHSREIAHRDVKCDNILVRLDRNGNLTGVKLADFGLAAYMEPQKQFSTPCGSPPYAAPEIVSMSNYQGSKTDVWALGVVMYTILEGDFPFNQPTPFRLKDQIRSGRFSMPKHISTDAQDLIARMLHKDPSKRITVEQILLHPWIKSFSADQHEEEFESQHVVPFTWDGAVRESAILTGNFLEWKNPIKLHKVIMGNSIFFTSELFLSPGVYQYKFIIDGVWCYDPRKPIMDDGFGNINNFIRVNGEGLEVINQNSLSSSGVFNLELD